MGLMDELKKIIHPYDDEDYDYDEPDDIDSDMGFDPYTGCFSDDC